jgi:hypothetical protein
MEIIIIAIVIGLIPAAIAQSKGHNFGAWWLYGACLFIVALPHSLLLKSHAIQQRRIMAYCSACGQLLQQGVPFCASCGAAQSGMGQVLSSPPRTSPPILKIALISVGTLLGVGFVIGLSRGLFEDQKPSSIWHEAAQELANTPAHGIENKDALTPVAASVASNWGSDADDSIKASLLVFSYENNEVGADQDFKGRRFSVSGKIGKIGKDILGTPYVIIDQEENGLRGVQAFFSERDLPLLAQLHPDQMVKVKGTCDGLMMNVLLKNSAITSIGRWP